MKKSTIDAISVAIAAILEDLGGAATDNTPESPATPPAGEAAPKRGRGRPPTEPTSTPPSEPEKPAEPAVKGKTTEELKAIIAPAVEAGMGEDVKKIIAKHGGTKCADIPAANHVAFARDIEALTM